MCVVWAKRFHMLKAICLLFLYRHHVPFLGWWLHAAHVPSSAVSGVYGRYMVRVLGMQRNVCNMKDTTCCCWLAPAACTGSGRLWGMHIDRMMAAWLLACQLKKS